MIVSLFIISYLIVVIFANIYTTGLKKKYPYSSEIIEMRVISFIPFLNIIIIFYIMERFDIFKLGWRK